MSVVGTESRLALSRRPRRLRSTEAIRALVRFHEFLGDEFTVEHPHRSGNNHTLREVAQDLADRLTAIFLPDATGRRPVFGGTKRSMMVFTTS